MQAIHHGNLHGTLPKTNKTRYHYARQRVQDAQKGKVEEDEPKVREPTPTHSSHNTVLIVLLIMTIITWGIAGTAYFGIVDYKGLLARTSNISAIDTADYVSSLYPFQYNAVRHPLKTIGAFLSSIDDYITDFFTFNKDLSKRSSETPSTEEHTPPLEDVSSKSEKEEVAKVKEPEKSSKKQEQKSGDTKASEPKPESSPKPKSKPESTGKQKSKPEKKGKDEKLKDEPSKTKRPRTTSEEDKPIKEDLKKAQKLLDQKAGDQAYKFLKKLAEDNPESPKAKFLLAQSEEMVADKLKSNPMVQQSIKTYSEVAAMSNCPKELKKQALMAMSTRQQFLGRMKPALETQLELAKMYPRDVDVLNKLGVRYLMLGRNKEAKKVYEKVLEYAPDDGFALVHMGFIIKYEGSWKESIPFLKRGVESLEPGTQEGKFYFHLGDALHRTNRTKEAEEVYEDAAKKGLFRSKYQRSLYNVDRLRGKPFWTPEDAGAKDYVRRLEMNWKVIRDEALSVMDKQKGLFLLEEESLKDTGEWRQFTLFQRGAKNEENCRRTPKTCSLIERMPNAKGCRRGQVKFSVMMPGTHVWAHTGPTNCRLRMHLGLVIPKTGSGARLACAGEMRAWEEGKVFIFDDSFEHEVWQEAESFRLILIVDVWHPDLTEHEKKTLSAI